MEQKYRHNRRLKLMTLFILLLAVIAWVAWSFWPSSARQMKRSVAIVTCRSWYEMACGGKTGQSQNPVATPPLMHIIS